MIALVATNLAHRPTRTVLSILLIGVPVTLMLTLVGLSRGLCGGHTTIRTRGIGADIIVRSPDSSIGSLALYPGVIAARQDPIEALAYE